MGEPKLCLQVVPAGELDVSKAPGGTAECMCVWGRVTEEGWPFKSGIEWHRHPPRPGQLEWYRESSQVRDLFCSEVEDKVLS
jgi:hypothetical protein